MDSVDVVTRSGGTGPRASTILDSGASHHISGILGDFAEIRQLDEPKFFHGIGGCAACLHEGTLVFNIIVRNQHRILKVNNVYYHPGYNHTLLGVADFAIEGLGAEFVRNKGRLFQECDRAVVAEFDQENGQYELLVASEREKGNLDPNQQPDVDESRINLCRYPDFEIRAIQNALKVLKPGTYGTSGDRSHAYESRPLVPPMTNKGQRCEQGFGFDTAS